MNDNLILDNIINNNTLDTKISKAVNKYHCKKRIPTQEELIANMMKALIENKLNNGTQEQDKRIVNTYIAQINRVRILEIINR